jgi:folate-binding protein YgfZ
VLVPRAGLAKTLAGQDLAGTWASEALRVAAWRPRLGFETDHRTIPHELDWLRTAVHLQKGCYRGQETVARVHNLGRPPRRLVLLHLDGSENVLPAPGAPVLLGNRAVGHVTTPVRHHELGPVALALVKRSVPADAVLGVDGVPAAQELVVAP